MAATEDIFAGDIVGYIPSEYLLTRETTRSSPIVQKLDSKNFDYTNFSNIPEMLPLIIFVLEQSRNPDSKWYNYVQSYPTDWSSFPLMYTDEERQWLEGSMTGSRLDFDIKKLRQTHNFLSRAIPEFTFTFEEFRAANLGVKSRSYGLEINGTKQGVLVPYCDMFNFVYGINAEWAYKQDEQGREGYFLTATSDIPKGAEVYLSYGLEDNYRMLHTYGYMFEKNVVQMPIALDITLDKSSPNYDLKNELIGEELKLQLSLQDRLNEALSVLRLALYEGDEAELLERGKEYKQQGRIRPISRENERAVLQLIGKRMQRDLADFRTTITGDKHLLEKADLTENQRNMVMITYEEKIQVKKLLDWVENILDKFEMEDKELIEHIEGLEGKYPYLRSVLLPFLKSSN